MVGSAVPMRRSLATLRSPPLVGLLAFGALAPQAVAHAAPPPTAATPGVAGSATKETSSTTAVPWIRRYAPVRNMFELGVFGGLLFPARDHELFEPDPQLLDQGYQPLEALAGAAGARFAYAPARVFALEVEGAVFPTRTTRDQAALLWAARGHALIQLPWWSVTPFVLVGTGAMGVESDRAALGSDTDLALHFGGGVKMFVRPRFSIRIDVRDIVAARRGVEEGLAHNPEVTAGFGLTLGRKRARPPSMPLDRDRDGFLDPDDRCPDDPGVAPEGCPPPDRDRDGVLDPDDACPDEPGAAPHGCPPRDSDNDGVLDSDDACPDEPGAPPQGCPPRDTDDDGFLDSVDRCIDEAETVNGFDDEDGCPDVVPGDMEAYTGIIEGIFFDSNKDTIRKVSLPKLDAAVETLALYPSISLEISGHTDNRGNREYNMDLSARRADAVRTYLIEHGVSEDRIQTRGAGPDEPIDTNRTPSGRAKNRRIEFQILQ